MPRLRHLAAAAAVILATLTSPAANADTGPSTQPVTPGGPSNTGAGGAEGGGPDAQLAPGEAVFLCPGVGGSANVVGAGGGYCDFNFARSAAGTGHVHCEWGGFSPILSMWNCWRVFPGQPDHPANPDPDIIPDGWGVPWAILGPTRDDQWPPAGLAPAADFAPPEQPPPPQQLSPEQPPPPPPPEEPGSAPAP